MPKNKKSRTKIEKLVCQLCLETLPESSDVYRCANNHLFCSKCSGSNNKRLSKKKVMSLICVICSEPLKEKAKKVLPVVDLDNKDPLQNQCTLQEQAKKVLPAVDLDAKHPLQNQWTLWYFSKDFSTDFKVTNWEDKQKEVIIIFLLLKLGVIF